MGTIQKSVNLFKRIFQGVKNVFQRRTKAREIDEFLTPHKMMTRKRRIPRSGRQYHGAKQRQHHRHGGGRVSLNMSDGAIYTPKRRKLKGWQKENRKYTS
jgi:hypothetical protein